MKSPMTVRDSTKTHDLWNFRKREIRYQAGQTHVRHRTALQRQPPKNQIYMNLNRYYISTQLDQMEAAVEELSLQDTPNISEVAKTRC